MVNAGGRQASRMLLLIFRTTTLTLLLILLHHLLIFQRRVEVEARIRQQQRRAKPAVRAALVTLADPSFQHCALQLLRSARMHGWDQPIILLAIDYDEFEATVTEQMEVLGAIIVHTNPVFDEWLEKGAENIDFYRTLQPNKFRKMELFFNPVLRAYERLVYVDADGVLDASLDPLLSVPFPENTTLLMRQNDISFGKKSLWANEIAIQMLTDAQLDLLWESFPNRVKTGGSCWFLVDVKKLPSPGQILSRSLELLCTFRAGFRFNDQTLISLLFYDSISLFPWCVWDEVHIIDEPDELVKFCTKNQNIQRWLNGKLKFMYRHMNGEEKQICQIPRPINAMYIRTPGNDSKAGNETIEPPNDERFLAHAVDSRNCMEALQQWRTRLPEYR